MWDEVAELKDRVTKIEINQCKKAVVITGLYTDDIEEKGKFLVAQQVSEFLAETIGFKAAVDDVYEIGNAVPRSKVVVFQSIKDKELIIKFKPLLKEFRNEDDKPYFINEYYGQQQNAVRQRNRQIFKQNEERQDTDKPAMELKGTKLLINGAQYVNKIEPPNPQRLLDLSVEELNNIMGLKICKGPHVDKDENTFRAFVYSVDTFQQVQDAYFKMRICHPKARHILCAYVIPGDELHYTRGCCDDGEHNAAEKVLQAMVHSKMEKTDFHCQILCWEKNRQRPIYLYPKCSRKVY